MTTCKSGITNEEFNQNYTFLYFLVTKRIGAKFLDVITMLQISELVNAEESNEII